jgi:amino-acid N-acetyltransferase
VSPDDSPFIAIRAARRGDAPDLHRFIHPFVEDAKLLPRTEAELETLIEFGFVAESDGRIVGFAALEIYSRKLAEIRSLAVEPDFRRHGVGRRLVQACVDRAREAGVFEVMAITSTEAFFLACGFDFTLPGEKKALFFQTRELP